MKPQKTFTAKRIIPALLVVGIAVYIFFAADLPLTSVPNDNSNDNTTTTANTTGASGGSTAMTFDECVAEQGVGGGTIVQESYPRKCVTPDGETFTEDIGNELEKTDQIRITSPRPNDTVNSPLTIEGEALGLWFFEGSFPITILDANGETLGSTVGQAEGNWMSENFVSFTAEITFTRPETEKGTLILSKDNPSGLNENSDELRVPVDF
ncbi:Gmad2 immunoglobulin-like domain-containing protein [Patescibacteria group bacterium]